MKKLELEKIDADFRAMQTGAYVTTRPDPKSTEKEPHGNNRSSWREDTSHC
jgi:hypothetical protein